ncbi:MAG: leucyl aminopeptidase [Thermodesulfobacteriota bacterium]|nr:leucyl aminopeptidase [Thermodesulfobacteriota bacterium]
MIKVIKTPPEKYGGDMAVYFVRQPAKKGHPKCPCKECRQILSRAFDTGDFLAKEGQTLMFYPEKPGKDGNYVKRVLIVGLGKDDFSREIFRKGGGAASSAALKTKAKKIIVTVPEAKGFSRSELTECLVEGLLLGAYRFRKYKTNHNNNNDNDNEEESAEIDEIALYTPPDAAGVRKGLKLGSTAAGAVGIARDMANEPGNYWTPSRFADYGRELADKYGFKASVLLKPDLKRLGMGGILGVSQGSAQPPALVILEYRTGKKVPTLLIVGKGLTFDSGGISLKPPPLMDEMKYDMCGGAAVLAAMQAIGEEKPKRVDVVAIVPATENLPGPSALKPGDVITHYGGKTVEVINTDAEGRLILADALAYGVDKFKPDAVIDLATLTGAVIVGLGHHRIGMLSNDDILAENITRAGERSGELLWRLPLGSEYTKQLKSRIADMKNVGGRAAGTITAAAFLEKFVRDVPWVHLDIAGTAWNYTKKSYMPKGPSGIGVRMLLELTRAWR